MKSITYARLALLFPYLTLIGSLIYSSFFNADVEIGFTLNNIWIFFAIFWFIPYTILTIYLLVRSRGKSMEQIRSIFIFAPLQMIVVSIGTYLVVLIIGSLFARGLSEFGMLIFVLASTTSIAASLVIGYFLVGITFLIYKFLQTINFIRD